MTEEMFIISKRRQLHLRSGQLSALFQYQYPHGLYRGLYGKAGVVAVGIAHAFAFALLVPDNIKHTACPRAQDLADNIKGGAFHL